MHDFNKHCELISIVYMANIGVLFILVFLLVSISRPLSQTGETTKMLVWSYCMASKENIEQFVCTTFIMLLCLFEA